MTRLAALVLAFALGGAFPGASVSGQNSQETPAGPGLTFKSGVDLVSVSVVVKDQKGRPVTGLSRKNFELFDAGRPREIADFRAEASSVSVAVVLDTSGSMHISGKWNSARDAVAKIASELERGRDRIALFAFDNQLHVLQPFTTSPSDVLDALAKVQPWGSTAMFDAISETSKRLEADGTARRAIVVITDGLDNRSRLDATDVSATASAIDVPVYSFVVSSPLDRLNDETAAESGTLTPSRGTLDDLSRWTGGASFVSGTPMETASAVKQIITELRHQYVMTFESGSPAGWHPLLVRVRESNNFVVRTRSGYIAGPRWSGRS
ncbi:MAG TPA: VWA domain-containing protein [Vicinamibacterales bacterium]|nr:VWA domain-containing protein [Vicinamibacterales bacterium]